MRERAVHITFRAFLFAIPFQAIGLVTLGGFGLQPVHVTAVALGLAVAWYAATNSIHLSRAVAGFAVVFLPLLIGLFFWGYTTGTPPGLTQPRPSRPGQLLYWTAAVGYLILANIVAATVTVPSTARRDWQWFLGGGLVVMAIGIWHYFAVTVGLPFPQSVVFSNPSFGYNVTTYTAGVLRFVGPFPEPSMFAVYTTMAAAVAYGLREWWALALFVGGLLLSLSTTAYIGLVGLATLVAIHHRDRIRPAIIGAAAIGATALVLLPPTREATVGKVDSRSVANRSEALLEGLRAWATRPILGWGLGAERTFDALSNTLINIGLAGVIPLAVLFFRASQVRVRRYGHLLSGLKIGLAVVVGLHLVSEPGVTKPYVWPLAGYLLGTATAIRPGEIDTSDQTVLDVIMDASESSLLVTYYRRTCVAYRNSQLRARIIQSLHGAAQHSYVVQYLTRLTDNQTED
jgi:hypothetical protein